MLEESKHHLRNNDRIVLPNLDEEGPITVWIESDGEPAFDIKFDFDLSRENAGIRMRVQPMPMEGTSPPVVEVWSEG